MPPIKVKTFVVFLSSLDGNSVILVAVVVAAAVVVVVADVIVVVVVQLQREENFLKTFLKD